MEVELKEHKWGERAIVTLSEDREVEVMRFDKAGSDHKHDVDEIAVCISGKGFIFTDDPEYQPSRFFHVTAEHSPYPVRIRAGVMHHMEPERPYRSTEPFEFIIWYE